MITRARLERLDEQGRPIRVGIVGLGAMGAGVLHTMGAMAGMRCVAAADLDPERAAAAFQANGLGREDLVFADNPAAAAGRGGGAARPVITQDGLELARMDLDVVVEATGSTEFGARIAYESILARKHVLMLTVESDVVVGPLLARMARSAGVVYSLVAGDQPGAILELVHWAETLGLSILAAGRGVTMYPEDRHGAPGPEKRGRIWISHNPKMSNSFRDGTKSQIEMAAVSNCTGLVPEVRGMHGPQVGVDDLARVFALREHGGILSRAGVVEVANSVTARGDLVPHGQVGNGVFVVVDSTHPGVERFLRQAFAHQGEHGAALFRPYHLTCVEVPMSIARAALDGEATAAPRGFFTEVACSAKRDLSAGDELDGGGGSTVYAQVERAETARTQGLLPIGFADGVRLRRPIKKDQPVKWADVEVKDDGFLARLRRLQDSTIG